MIAYLSAKRVQADLGRQVQGDSIEDLERSRRRHPVRDLGDVEIAEHTQVEPAAPRRAVLKDHRWEAGADALKDAPERLHVPPEGILHHAVSQHIAALVDEGVVVQAEE